MIRALNLHDAQTSTTDAIQNTAAHSHREPFQDIVGPSKKRKRERYVENEADADHDGDHSIQNAQGSNEKVRMGTVKTKEDESSA